MESNHPDLAVLYEHPSWQEPLFQALKERGLDYAAVDLKSATLSDRDRPEAPLYLNQASPSAYTRGNTRAVPFALAVIEDLEARGVPVLNGSRPFRLELSKMAQVSLMRELDIDHPRTWAFNDVAALRERRAQLSFPALIKPNQGGSGARMIQVDSFEDLEATLEDNPSLWHPDHLLLLQEYLPHDTEGEGIVRMEYLGGELLYAMRVVSKGNFNLCPSEVCNPSSLSDSGGDGPPADTVEENGAADAGPDFHPYPDVPDAAVATGARIMQEGGFDLGSVEYLETDDGRRVFYDVNANSNLRRPIGKAFGFDPFERVVDFLEKRRRTLLATE
jgi:glutathione synthase/RimK-type ligase-like ATP-grasp enzyme